MSGDTPTWTPGMRVVDIDGDRGVVVDVVGRRLRISYGCTGSGRRWDDLLAWQPASECKVATDDPILEIARLRAEVERLTAERDAAQSNYEFMVTRAAGEKLDGYRELGQRAADAERDAERLTAERDALADVVGQATVRTSLMPGEYRPATHALTVAVDALREHALATESEVARLRERVAVLEREREHEWQRARIAESPVVAKIIIAAWSAAGDQMYANQPVDTPASICLDGVDLDSIHRGTPTGATHARCSPNLVAQLHKHVAEARREAKVWRARGWGDPTGKHKFPWEDSAPTGATPSTEMTAEQELAVWRAYAAENFITLAEHEENRAIEAREDAEAERASGAKASDCTAIEREHGEEWARAMGDGGATPSEPDKHAGCTPTSHCGGDDCPGAARDW